MMEVKTDQIEILGWNPRKEFDEGAMGHLRQSIEAHGIIEPLIVRQNGNGGYDMVAGERRFRAAKQLNLGTVPVVVREMDDGQVREIMLLENLQREDLQPLEEAAAIRQLLDKSKLTQTELGKRIGKSQGWVANRLRLMRAPEEIRELIISRKINVKQALSMLPYFGYPVFDEVIKVIQDNLKNRDFMSNEDLEKAVDSGFQRSKYALCLDPESWDRPDWWKHYRNTGCNKCRKFRKIKKSWGGTKRYCYDTDCTGERIETAKAKLKEETKKKEKAEKERRKVSEAAGSPKVVSKKEFSYSAFEELKRANFDTYVCTGCPDKVKVEGKKGEWCMKWDCFRGKQRAAKAQETILNKQLDGVAMEAVHKFVTEDVPVDIVEVKGKVKVLQVPMEEVDRLLSIIVLNTDHHSSEPKAVRNAFKCVKGKPGSYYRGHGEAEKKLKDEEKGRILLSAAYWLPLLTQGRSDWRFTLDKDIERHVPGALVHYRDRAAEIRKENDEKVRKRKEKFLGKFRMRKPSFEDKGKVEDGNIFDIEVRSKRVWVKYNPDYCGSEHLEFRSDKTVVSETGFYSHFIMPWLVDEAKEDIVAFAKKAALEHDRDSFPQIYMKLEKKEKPEKKKGKQKGTPNKCERCGDMKSSLITPCPTCGHPGKDIRKPVKSTKKSKKGTKAKEWTPTEDDITTAREAFEKDGWKGLMKEFGTRRGKIMKDIVALKGGKKPETQEETTEGAQLPRELYQTTLVDDRKLRPDKATQKYVDVEE